MANDGRASPLLDPERPNPYTSSSRWRHQESSAFLKHASQQNLQPASAREDAVTGQTGDLADFLNTTRIETGPNGASGSNYKPVLVAAGHANDGKQPQDNNEPQRGNSNGKQVVCGPLLNYRRMENGRWHGSVLVVIEGGGQDVFFQPWLILSRVGAVGQADHANGAVNGDAEGNRFESQRLYSDTRNTFWSFDIDLPLEEAEVQYQYTVPELHFEAESKPRVNKFFVPAATESMRVMFHSCNGFSVGTDEDAWSGAALWNDVLRKHKDIPYHVMVGGGDQIYNDGIRVGGPLKGWTEIQNPRKRRDFPFPEKLRGECDDYYLNNYIRWYSTEPFSTANGQIPQLNIWDDHDIIDGFGSYTDHFMRCDVFRGIGGVAHKYYMLFQHHLPPPPSTYTSDSVESQKSEGTDPKQLMNTFVAESKSDPSYIVGSKPGPYVAEHSFNLYARLGARIALLGIDARTERTRHQINYPETYNLIFDRLKRELSAAASSDQPIGHLILLLGIPIAYPRLTWLENVLRSPLMGPVRFLNRRFGVAGGIFNHFDGNPDLLDDLDDHYTARTHKQERHDLIVRLQEVAAEYSVRVTILGGDVHLAALGRFYSHPKLNIPVEQDHRYMANVISSAIVNKPPPQAVANLLAKRNKIHHLNPDTDETLLDFFDKDPGNSNKTMGSNHCTMPSRNYATLTENSPYNGSRTNGANGVNGTDSASFKRKDGHSALHQGEVGAGSKHKSAAVESHGHDSDGSLDIRINVEIDQHDRKGLTEGYGLTVPRLQQLQPSTSPAVAA